MSMVRVNDATHKNLKELAAQQGTSIQTVLDRAIDAYRKQTFLEQLNADFAALRRDSAAWTEESEERALWDKSLADGLEDQ